MNTHICNFVWTTSISSGVIARGNLATVRLLFMFAIAALETLYLLYRALKIGLHAVDGIY
ncbi:hypothetical protein T4E_8842 [Trichinella pseudospiralis]|uniref:Uncharacterized protein n=1 Tax=Trichinella pseudospiralis TaxID=6337 RepID=A0A0V0XV40_TRIPS|nr:hypothetical protein T4E_8842 [Trichinella pseudospiralis]